MQLISLSMNFFHFFWFYFHIIFIAFSFFLNFFCLHYHFHFFYHHYHYHFHYHFYLHFFFFFILIGNLTRKRDCTNSMIVLRSDEALFFLLAHTNTDIVSAVCGALVNLSGDPGWRFLYCTAKGNNQSVHFYFNFL